MALTPGRPHEATLHPRTRPEANEYAMRNRGTSDWFRHDGKNVEEIPPPVPRLADKNAEEIASKAKGDPEEWYQHNPDNTADPPPAPRCTTDEAKHSQEKNQGKEEVWFKHDENQEYMSARQENLPDFGPARSFKVKFTKPDTNEWYKHAEGGGSPMVPIETPKTKKAMSPRKAPNPPNWYGHDGKTEVDGSQLPPRMTHPDAETYLHRNHGSATNWFGHDGTVEAQSQNTPRVVSKEGSDIAKRLGRESENWFDYDKNKDYRETRTEGRATNVDKSSSQMSGVMAMSPDDEMPPKPRVRPEAQDVAQKNIDGMMNKYMTENKDYNSPRPQARIKPEASDTAEKNQGVMSDCMGGYPDPPSQHGSNRVKTDAAEYALRNQGTMGNVMYGGSQSSADRPSQARAVRPEAQMYAQRNQGSLSQMFDNSVEVSEQRTPRLTSAEARQIATRNQGGMAGVMGFSG